MVFDYTYLYFLKNNFVIKDTSCATGDYTYVWNEHNEQPDLKQQLSHVRFEPTTLVQSGVATTKPLGHPSSNMYYTDLFFWIIG